MTKISANPRSPAGDETGRGDVVPSRFMMFSFAAFFLGLFWLAPGPIPVDVTVQSVLLSIPLIWLSAVDLRDHRIPDATVIAITGLGLLMLWQILPEAAIAHIGAALGIGLFFWLLSEVWCRVRHEDALGLGDVKLIAAATLWVGPTGFASFLLLATLGGIAASLLSISRGVPFGPFLAISLWITWLFGPMIG